MLIWAISLYIKESFRIKINLNYFVIDLTIKDNL